MLDFRTPSQRRIASLRSDQRRLAYLVFAAGLAFVLVIKAADPAYWRWIDRWASPQSPADRIDNRVDRLEGVDHSPSHSMKVVPHVAGSLEETGNDGGANDSPVATRPANPKADTTASAPGDASVAHAQAGLRGAADRDDQSATAPSGHKDSSDDRTLPGIAEYYLREVRDDTVFRQEEQDAWFNILEVLNRTEESIIRRASLGPTSFAQLYRQSHLYRGRVVSTAGIVRQVDYYSKVAKNSAGIESYYRLTFFPNDNRDTPMFIYCLTIPDGFPRGTGLEEYVEADAVFFKRWVYEARGGLFTTPTLLAKTVRWQPRPRLHEDSPVPSWLPLVIIAAAVASVCVSLVIYHRTKTIGKHDHPEKLDFEKP